MPARDFEGTFRVLRALLEPYAPRLHAAQDTASFYMLDGEYVPAFKRAMPFGGVQIRRAYVSFHLLPVYSHPELLGRISDALRRHLHGKSCFNFVRPERELLVELSALVDAGFDLYARLGWVK
ncbi:MAG TPA: hypothetical protein VMF11_01005 [Candidatus Baltobacteraceae bacterium]|nr:hypothetical protein [Candidatus Baltobacteraceae bacterium]